MTMYIYIYTESFLLQQNSIIASNVPVNSAFSLNWYCLSEHLSRVAVKFRTTRKFERFSTAVSRNKERYAKSNCIH